jgi:hypothetical protein
MRGKEKFQGEVALKISMPSLTKNLKAKSQKNSKADSQQKFQRAQSPVIKHWPTLDQARQ